MNDPLPREVFMFNAALQLPANQRADYLSEACGDDGELRSRVSELLQAHESAGLFLRDSDHRPSATTDAASVRQRDGGLNQLERPGENCGDRVGSYKLLQQIGEGGCGIVYMAEQEEPVRRRVALKVIKLGMDTKQVIARFEAERQALAMMDHPNIAKVLDAGATATGRPYFVMELVRGVQLTDFCDSDRLSTEARLQLFIQICHAIQHAHQKGVIHRDIKPSNILVSVNDGLPVPKVIDFGIAKATQGRLTDQTLFTPFEQFIGTPAYMSPEQAVLTNVEVDTRSDIYSLGVLLYELLTGQTPFAQKELLASGLDEMRRTIREKDPIRPSTRLSAMVADDLATVARNRHSQPPQLIHLVRGDLDWIVMKCLQKERARRYETANGLALDLERHLGNQPVLARPDILTYRMGKFVRRHRGSATIAAVVFLALIGGLTGTITQARRATRHAGRAEAERRRADEEAAASRAVSDFLRDDLLAKAGPEREPDRDLKLRTVLDRAAERIDGRFANPLVEADVRDTLGATYRSLGEFAAARQHWERVFALRQQGLGPDDPKTMGTAGNLADVLRLQGKYSEAEALASSVLAAKRRVLGPEHPETLSALNDLGLITSKQGKLAETESTFAELLELRRRVSGPDHPDTLAAMNNFAGALLSHGKREQGTKLYLEVLDSARRVYGPDHPKTLSVTNNIAHMYLGFGELAEAEQYCSLALASRRRVLGPEHPETLISFTTLARIYGAGGKLAEAEVLDREILEIQRRTLGPEYPDAIVTTHNLAACCRDQGRIEEAEELHTRALAMFKRVFGAEHPFTLNSMGKLTQVYCDLGKTKEAIALGSETSGICERVLGGSHVYTAQALCYLGVALLRDQKPGEAEPVLRRSLATASRSTKPWETSFKQGQLGRALLLLGRYNEAEPLLLEAHNGLVKDANSIPPADRHEVRASIESIVLLYRKWNRPEEAEKWGAVLTK